MLFESVSDDLERLEAMTVLHPVAVSTLALPADVQPFWRDAHQVYEWGMRVLAATKRNYV